MTSDQEGTDDVFMLALYLLTSARGCLEEPRIYGVVRLLEALVRLVDFQSNRLRPDSFLEAMKMRVDRLKIDIMEDPQKVQKELDKTIREFTIELEKRTI